MTLVMTQVSPWGILQCSDYRNTDMGAWPPKVTDDWSCKHLSVHTPDGVALIGYAGVGAFSLGGKRVIMSDWIAETVSGETRSLAGTFEHIRQEATDLFRNICIYPHLFSIGAFDGDHPCYVEIHNIAGCDTTGMPQAGSEFFVTGSRVLLPSIVVVGSGRRAVTEDDQRLLRMRLGVQPERPEELMELFAEVNKRASEHFLYGGTITQLVTLSGCHPRRVPLAD